MLSENRNRHEWKDGLDKLASLPGEVFDGSEAWEKLHQRLSVKKGKKKVGVYWMVAAIAASFIIFFLFNLREAVVPKDESVTTKIEMKKGDKLEAGKLIEPTELIQRSVVQPRRLNHNTIVKAKKGSSKPYQKEPLMVADPTSAIATIPSQNIAPANDSLTESIVVKRVKRKLRVVHINELDQPHENKDHFVRVGKTATGMKMLSGGSFSNTISNSYADDNILEIKLSPNN